MFDMGVAPPYCTPEGAAAAGTRGTRDGCGSFSGAVLFWVTFKVVTTFVIDAVLGATVLKALWEEVPPSSAAYLPWRDPRGRRLFVFSHAHGRAFRDAWALVVDPHGEGARATRHQVASILLLLPPPLGLMGVLGNPDAARDAAEEAVASMPLLVGAAEVVVEGDGQPAREGVPFHLALHALVLYASRGFEAELAGGTRLGARKWDLAESAALALAAKAPAAKE
jgi:hypothetical protein